MVLMWLFGDIAKLVFYVLQKQPIQFVFCATFQITFDALIMAQFFLFKKTETEEKVDDVAKAIQEA